MGGERLEGAEDPDVVLVVLLQLEAVALGDDQGDLEDVDRVEAEAFLVERCLGIDLLGGDLQVERLDDQPRDLALLDPADRSIGIEARIQQARAAEAAARAADPRIVNSEGTQVSSGFSEIVYGDTRGFLGSYESAMHSLSSEPIARENGSLQRDYWLSVGHRLSDLEDPAAIGRRAAQRALRRLGARRVPTCEVPVIFEAHREYFMRQRDAVKTGFEEVLRRHGARGALAIVDSGSPLISDSVIAHGRQSDLIVLSQVDSSGNEGVELDFVDRVAMAAGVLALSVPGVTVTGAEAVRKSYPAYFEDLAALTE